MPSRVYTRPPGQILWKSGSGHYEIDDEGVPARPALLLLCREIFGPNLTPRLMYKVWEKGGHEDLVRGGAFGDLDTRSLRSNLIAAGDEAYVDNHMLGCAPGKRPCLTRPPAEGDDSPLKGARMTVFGKSLSDYVRFQRVILGLILVVGVARLLLSLAGVSDNGVKFLSMTVVTIAGVFYYGIRVHTSGFGSYMQLLPLLVIQAVLANSIAIVGIVIAHYTLHPNIFTAPEFGGLTRARWHILGHLTFGNIAGPLVSWLLASIVMWVTKRVSQKKVH